MILTALPQTQPRRPMFRLAAIGVLAGCLSLATGCGITPDDTPRAFPSDLTDPVPVTPDAPSTGDESAPIYLVDGESQLVPVKRDVRQVTVAAITRATLASPTADEVDAGVSTSIPRNTKLLSGEVRADGVIAIDLSKEFLQVDGAVRTTAIGQIVLGVGSQFHPDRRFRFFIAGQRATISTADGAQNTVTPCDFVGAMAQPAKLDATVEEAVDLVTLVEQRSTLSSECSSTTD